MSTFKDITQLRKDGRLEEALEKTGAWITEEEGNIWARRAASWVFYDYLKQAKDQQDREAFLSFLEKIVRLELPADEEVFFQNVAMISARFLFQQAKASPDDFPTLAQTIFEKIRDFPIPRPNWQASFLLKGLHKGLKESSHYPELIRWWGWDSFQPDDYQKEEFNGRRIMSLAEQVFIQYAKKLLPPKGSGNMPFLPDKEAILAFLPVLNATVEKHPHLTFLPYFQAKLMLLLGDGEHAFHAILPFARKKQREYWVWQVLAEAFSGDEETQMACYAKALTCGAPEDFLINIREELAERLIDRGRLAEAKYEIEKCLQTRAEHNWRIPGRISRWKQEAWFGETRSVANNQALYREFIPQAEALLYRDLPEQTGILYRVDENRGKAYFVIARNLSGNFPLDLLKTIPREGQVVALRLRERKSKSDGRPWQQVLTARLTEEAPPPSLVKPFAGRLRKKENWDFGFVDDVFVRPELIQQHRLQGDDQIQGKAVLSWDGRKKEWGFRAVEAERSSLEL